MKLNCWEYKECGRETNGKNISVMGVCPACTETLLNGIHDGKNSGRAYWVISGTFCSGVIQGSYAKKIKNCEECEFFKKVKEDEGSNFKAPIILCRLLLKKNSLNNK